MKKFLLVLFCSALICGSAEASSNKQISLNVEVRVILVVSVLSNL